MKERFISSLTKNYVVCLIAMLCCFLWGSAFPCIKIGYRLFSVSADSTGSQILFAGYRFMLAGILVILFGSILNRRLLLPKRASISSIFKLGLVQTFLQYILFYIGLANTSGVKSSIIGGSNVFLSILVASLLFKYEKLSVRKILGSILGFSGVVIINLNGVSLDASMRFQGEGFIFLSALAYAFSSALIKKYSKAESPVTLSGYQFLLGGIELTVVGLIGGRVSGFSPASVTLLFYMAFISATAYTLWGILLKYNPVAKVSVYGFMNPVFGVMLSILFLREDSQAFGIFGIAALLLVCAGIYVVNKPNRKE